MRDKNSLESMLDYVIVNVMGEYILDVGTGFGTVVKRLLRDGKKIITLDPEGWTFPELEEDFKNEIKNGSLQLEKKGIEDYSHEGKKFDTSICIAALHHVKDPVAGLKRMEDLTSGAVIITDWNHKSAGKHNPHPEHELRSKMTSLIEYGEKNGYEISHHEYWYSMIKHKLTA
jgi:2-polyprenyl-3-methyl-5-hydroxy-6-metoxy-1,4-benzoquinol methylase